MSDALAASDAAPVPVDDLGRLEQIVDDVLGEATRLGASSAEAALSASAGLSVNVRMGDVETVEHVRDKGLGVTAYFGKRKGSASTTDFSTRALRETVKAACDIARFTAADDCAGLADAELMAEEIPDLELHHRWEIGPDRAIEIALEAETCARDHDPRITNSEGAGVDVHDGCTVYGNTHGFLGAYRGTRHGVSCVVIAQDEAGMQRDYWYSAARDPEALEDPASIGVHAAERAVARLGARRLASASVPAVFAAEVATSLFRHFVAAISGGSLYRRSSFLVDHLGKQVFPSDLRIHEQPHLPRAVGSAPFDGEGVANRARDVVSEGVLRGYVLSSYSARKLGMQTTGNAGGVHNLTVEPGELGLADLLREMDRGVLITELMGMGINIVTGDYSRGAAGYWVEGGRISHPVEEFTVAGNLRDMFLGIRRVGADVDRRGNYRTGSVLLERVTLAGE